MLKWWSNRNAVDVVGDDMASARALLPSLRLKLDKEGVAAARVYGEGLTEVAQALARTLGIEVDAILSGRGLGPNRIAAVLRDITAAQERCRQYLDSPRETAREEARKLAFGCQVMAHLYRMRLHGLSAPEERRAEANAIADTYANLTRVLWQIGAPKSARSPART
jgi:hypothetical protein